MSVTELPTNPYVSSWTWFFDTEDEAHSFGLGYKDELAEEEFFEYVEHGVEYVSEAGSWRLVVRYVDRRPDPSRPVAA